MRKYLKFKNMVVRVKNILGSITIAKFASFILGTGIIVALILKPFLHYNFQQTGFLVGLNFFKGFSAYPGGIADYLALFISQFFMFNLLGSFLIVAVASLQGFLTLDLVRRLAGNVKLHFTIFALVVIFGIMVLCDYRYPYYASIRLLFAFIFTWFFCLINSKHPKFSAVIWFLLAGLLFYMASGAALFVFALSTVLIFLITNKQRLWFAFIPVFLVVAGLLPYFGYKFIFPMSLGNLYKITMVRPPAMLAYSPAISLYIYYSLLPAFLLFVLFFRMLRAKISEKAVQQKVPAQKQSFFLQPVFFLSIELVACSLLGYFLIVKSVDQLKQNLLTIEYYAEHEQWKEVLQTSSKIKDYDFKVNFHVNRALAHLGQLPDRLFQYPQLLGSHGLFIDNTTAGSVTIPTSDLYFDLGFMSESQHWAFEAQTLLPNSPRIIKRLVLINLVNRKYLLAGNFLKILDQNMLYHDWVSKYQKYVADTALASSDPLIAEKRRFTPKKVVVNNGPFDNLKLLAETNKYNRMAYDYLLTYCILDSHFPQFVDYLQYYNSFNLKKLPRSWEEALVIYVSKNKELPAFITPQLISENCIKRFLDFNKSAKQFGNNSAAAKDALFASYGDTYWYYLLYLNPKVTNILQNKIEVL